MGNTLYEITSDILELKAMLDDDPESEFVRDTLEGLAGELDAKADGYCKVIKEFERHIASIRGYKEAVKAEMERLTEMERVDENNIDRLKKALFQAMQVTDRPKIDTGLFKISIRNNAMSLDKIPDSLPEKYLVQQNPTIDKRLLLADVKAGVLVEGVTTKQTQSLIIK